MSRVTLDDRSSHVKDSSNSNKNLPSNCEHSIIKGWFPNPVSYRFCYLIRQNDFLFNFKWIISDWVKRWKTIRYKALTWTNKFIKSVSTSNYRTIYSTCLTFRYTSFLMFMTYSFWISFYFIEWMVEREFISVCVCVCGHSGQHKRTSLFASDVYKSLTDLSVIPFWGLEKLTAG